MATIAWIKCRELRFNARALTHRLPSLHWKMRFTVFLFMPSTLATVR
ncbi:MAG: hypothetical protein WB784_05455 [Rhodanobacteraceae bacterium]